MEAEVFFDLGSLKPVLILLCFFMSLTCARTLFVIRRIWACRQPPFEAMGTRKSVKTMAVLGSGGHTTEMIGLLESLGPAYTPRHYIVASTDSMSRRKMEELEKLKNATELLQYTMSEVPRSREVAQSWGSSALSTLYASIYCFPIVTQSRPDLILVNGPGTCIPICLAGFFLTIVGIKRVYIVYVESICRVETLSLSGRILYWFADHILVQWPQLQNKYPRTNYIGRLL